MSRHGAATGAILRYSITYGFPIFPAIPLIYTTYYIVLDYWSCYVHPPRKYSNHRNVRLLSVPREVSHLQKIYLHHKHNSTRPWHLSVSSKTATSMQCLGRRSAHFTNDESNVSSKIVTIKCMHVAAASATAARSNVNLKTAKTLFTVETFAQVMVAWPPNVFALLKDAWNKLMHASDVYDTVVADCVAYLVASIMPASQDSVTLIATLLKHRQKSPMSWIFCNPLMKMCSTICSLYRQRLRRARISIRARSSRHCYQ